ncbi:HAD hydrolase-like protein [Modestobacter sp. VKM Ac-2986]|uniref:HAD hydrolase-like protein n=1 Tax=Modestobacter sp. VKM Ac-2986 TaxID=3004140 RepID=UPI0022AB9471|nr:HAD hydrolase-like protein [Modestobacter sp. VKM Ac-2986]MCZ2830001.1 HAD hydrolase-like protein [Modestobacter sp. VKM Ac-2986]
MRLHTTSSGAPGEETGRLVLFDLDGTLVDSTPGIWASIQVAAARLGLPEPTPGQLRSMVGPPLAEGFAEALGLTGADVERAVLAYRAHYTAGAMFDVTVYPGVPELLADLRAGGAVLAVATSKPEPFAVRILEHVGLLAAFDSVHGATLDGAVRHKEQVVAAALAAHPDGVAPVLVGDRLHDVLGARVHGVPCLGAGWGPAPTGELAAAGAAAVVATPAGVRAALAAL